MRAPTQDEFLEIYGSAVLRLLQDLLCVTTLFGAVVPTERSSMAPTILAFDCPVNVSTPLLSKLLVTLNANATQTTIEELGQDLISTYNAFISETYSTCQTTKYREVTNITILTNDSALGRGRVRGRQLKGIPISSDDIVLQLDGGCGGCNATELFFDSSFVSRDDFIQYYEQLVDTGLDFISEIATMDWPNISTFEISVIVEFVPQDIDAASLSSDGVLQQQLADIYVTTYNDLSRDYCDPYSRQLQSARIVTVGPNNTKGHIPLEMALIGTCSDCDDFGLSVYDEPEAQPVVVEAVPINGTGTVRRVMQTTSISWRSLQGSSSGSCYCSAHPVGDRAP